MPSAPPTAKTPSPAMGLTPMRTAPAAPPKAPCGMAWATNAAPRNTTTTPAITATSVAAIQVLTMNPENTLPPLRSVAGMLGAPARGQARRALGPAAPSRPRDPRHRARGQGEEEEQGRHEEA